MLKIKKYLNCVGCGKPKLISDSDQRYARCKKCAYKFRVESNTKNYLFCIDCGKEKKTYWQKRSSRCKSCSQKGIVASEDTRKLWSEQRTGRKCFAETRKKLSEVGKGREVSLETRTKLSNTKTGLNRSVEEYQEYLNSIEEEGRREKQGKNYQAKMWSLSVKKRDKFICQKCGSNKNLCAHHVESWSICPEKRFEVENGLTLCFECHNVVHGWSPK